MIAAIAKTALFGDLVVEAFDNAARSSNDPREVSRLATQSIAKMLRRAQSLFPTVIQSPRFVGILLRCGPRGPKGEPHGRS